MSLTETQIKSWSRWWCNIKYNVLLADEKLPAEVLTQIVDDVQTDISEEACLIPYCEHWKSVAGTGRYELEDYPNLYQRPMFGNDSIVWNDGNSEWPLKMRDIQVLERLKDSYTNNGTPEYAAIRQIGRYKHIVLLPRPDVALGDGSIENDPLRFHYYRLPLPLASTSGYPEIDPELHSLLRLGVIARVAERLEDPRAEVWLERFDIKLGRKSKRDGVKNPGKTRVRNRWANARLGMDSRRRYDANYSNS